MILPDGSEIDLRVCTCGADICMPGRGRCESCWIKGQLAHRAQIQRVRVEIFRKTGSLYKPHQESGTRGA